MSDTRSRIVRAVIHSLAERGLSGTTFQSVGRLAKVQRTHITYYFPNYDELVQAAVHEVVATAQEITKKRLESAQSPREKCLAILHAAFDHIERNPSHGAVLTVFYHLCAYHPLFRQMNATFRRLGEERIEATLQEVLKSRRLSRKRLEHLTKSVQLLIFGYLHGYVTGGMDQSLAEARHDAERAVMELLGLAGGP